MRENMLIPLKISLHNQVIKRIHIDIILCVIMLVCGAMLTWLSIARYLGYNAGMLDLGNMTQAIASVQRGQPLVFTYHDGDTSRLAFHVEFIYFLIAIPYMLWPDPRLLLIIQSSLFVLGAFPVYRLTFRHTGSMFAARGMALAYLLYPTAQTSILFDFHSDTLAMPLLLFALDALDRRAWRLYWLFVVLALSCKFYVALPIAAMGVIIWWRYGERKVGLLTGGLAVIYGMLAFLVIRPLFTTASTSEVHRGVNYLSFYFGQIHKMLATWDLRILSMFVVFGPLLLLIRYGWYWMLPGIPVAAAMLLSTGPGGSYFYHYHHYAIVVPFIFMAAIVGINQLQQVSVQVEISAAENPGQFKPDRRQRLGRNWRGVLGLSVAAVILFNIIFVDTPLNPQFWTGVPGRSLDSAIYGVIPRDTVKDSFLATAVPQGADHALAASFFLAPHLANRSTLYVVRYPDDAGGERFPEILPRVDYVLADSLFDYRRLVGDGFVGGITYEMSEIAEVMGNAAFDLVAMRDGLLLFQRDAAQDQVLEQQVSVVAAGARPVQAHFGETIGLVEAQIEPLGERRYRATFAWQLTGQIAPEENYVAVSRLEGVENARLVHVPTYILKPTSQWQPGQIIRETFDVEVPLDVAPGRYIWRVGWYTPHHSEAYVTDARSRITGSDEVVIETIVVP